MSAQCSQLSFAMCDLLFNLQCKVVVSACCCDLACAISLSHSESHQVNASHGATVHGAICTHSGALSGSELCTVLHLSGACTVVHSLDCRQSL